MSDIKHDGQIGASDLVERVKADIAKVSLVIENSAGETVTVVVGRYPGRDLQVTMAADTVWPEPDWFSRDHRIAGPPVSRTYTWTVTDTSERP